MTDVNALMELCHVLLWCVMHNGISLSYLMEFPPLHCWWLAMVWSHIFVSRWLLKLLQLDYRLPSWLLETLYSSYMTIIRVQFCVRVFLQSLLQLSNSSENYDTFEPLGVSIFFLFYYFSIQTVSHSGMSEYSTAIPGWISPSCHEPLVSL